MNATTCTGLPFLLSLRTGPLTAFALAATLSASALAQDVPAPGMQLSPLPTPAGVFSQLDTFEDGRYVVFDGVSVDVFASDGSLLSNLTTFPAFVFPSFVRIDPDESYVVVAESTNGTLTEVFLGGGDALIGSMPNAYDAVFEGPDTLIVSAATCGFGCGNEIWRVTVSTGAMNQIGSLPGASGPLARDLGGGLYYGTVTDQFPVPAGQSQVLYWDAGTVVMGGFLTTANAQLIGTGFDGSGSLAVDNSFAGGVYMTENFFPNYSRVIRVGPTQGSSEVLLDSRAGFTIGRLELQEDGGLADFAPFQPAEGGRLSFTSTDFAATLERHTLAPQRPGLAVTGVGTTGPGPFDVTVSDGPPMGVGLIYYCDQALYNPVETAYTAFQPPLFLGLDLGTLGSVPGFPIFLDGDGDGTQGFNNPGGVEGNYTLQVILLSGGVVGSTSEANL